MLEISSCLLRRSERVFLCQHKRVSVFFLVIFSEEFACTSRREEDERGEMESLCSRKPNAHSMTLLIRRLYAIMFKGDRLSVQGL